MSLKKGRHYGDYIKKKNVFSIIRKFYWLEVTTIFLLNVDILVSAHNKYLE
jgi:hypothetical protein